MVDVVDLALAVLEIDEVANGLQNVALGETVLSRVSSSLNL